MKKILFAAFLFPVSQLSAQNIDAIINPAAVQSIEQSLASDAMRGRGTFTPDIERAADYIESQFKAAGLKTWNGSSSYRQPFRMETTKPVSVSVTVDGQTLPEQSVAVYSSSAHIQVDDQSGYEKVFVKPGDNLMASAMSYTSHKNNYIVFVDTSLAKNFPRLTRLAHNHFKSDNVVIFLLTAGSATHFSVKIDQEVTESKPLANVVGILPGKSKKTEYVIFSGHYDHLGVGKPNEKGDSIYNGANDDASGVTAVILLARYFSQLHNNERTLVFAAFTAEEIGEYGSQYFSSQFNPDQVMAMFNIEMIGGPSKWGTSSAFITGYERSDMAKILEKNLQGSGFTFYPDPYPTLQLFYRSDNASLAKQGVPAHTISTTQIDVDKTYHTPADEIGNLDMNNMAQITKAIAISSTTIVQGKDTPTRVDTSQLR